MRMINLALIVDIGSKIALNSSPLLSLPFSLFQALSILIQLEFEQAFQEFNCGTLDFLLTNC